MPCCDNSARSNELSLFSSSFCRRIISISNVSRSLSFRHSARRWFDERNSTIYSHAFARIPPLLCNTNHTTSAHHFISILIYDWQLFTHLHLLLQLAYNVTGKHHKIKFTYTTIAHSSPFAAELCLKIGEGIHVLAHTENSSNPLQASMLQPNYTLKSLRIQ